MYLSEKKQIAMKSAKCRLCMCNYKKSSMMNVLEETELPNLKKQIFTSTSVLINENDNFSKDICEICMHFVTLINDFQGNCAKVQQIFECNENLEISDEGWKFGQIDVIKSCKDLILDHKKVISDALASLNDQKGSEIEFIALEDEGSDKVKIKEEFCEETQTDIKSKRKNDHLEIYGDECREKIKKEPEYLSDSPVKKRKTHTRTTRSTSKPNNSCNICHYAGKNLVLPHLTMEEKALFDESTINLIGCCDYCDILIKLITSYSARLLNDDFLMDESLLNGYKSFAKTIFLLINEENRTFFRQNCHNFIQNKISFDDLLPLNIDDQFDQKCLTLKDVQEEEFPIPEIQFEDSPKEIECKMCCYKGIDFKMPQLTEDQLQMMDCSDNFERFEGLCTSCDILHKIIYAYSRKKEENDGITEFWTKKMYKLQTVIFFERLDPKRQRKFRKNCRTELNVEPSILNDLFNLEFTEDGKIRKKKIRKIARPDGKQLELIKRKFELKGKCQFKSEEITCKLCGYNGAPFAPPNLSEEQIEIVGYLQPEKTGDEKLCAYCDILSKIIMSYDSLLKQNPNSLTYLQKKTYSKHALSFFDLMQKASKRKFRRSCRTEIEAEAVVFKDLFNLVFTEDGLIKKNMHIKKKIRSTTVCHVCGEDVLTKTYDDHISKHDNVKQYKCEYNGCDTWFYTYSTLKGHILNYHLRKYRVHCEACGRGFNSKSLLNKHMRYHSEPKEKCDFCEKLLFTKSSLRIHKQRVHSAYTDRPFKCQLCDKRFFEAHRLKVHMRVHTQERPYVCEYCNMTFPYKCSLKSHEEKYHK